MFFKATSYTQALADRAKSLKSRMNANERASLARDMGCALEQPDLNAAERALAEEIIQKLVNDEIILVRSAIAEAVAGSPHLPAKIAQQLADDIEEVAIPVLELSPVLEDQFLEAIIKSGATSKIRAISSREIVSENICQRIVESGQKGPVVRLLQNPGAKISSKTMITTVRVYGDDQRVEKAVFDRGELPDEVINTLCDLAEAHVVSFVKRYFNLPEHVVDVQKGRNMLKGVKKKRRASDDDKSTADWWDSKSGVK